MKWLPKQTADFLSDPLVYLSVSVLRSAFVDQFQLPVVSPLKKHKISHKQ